VASFTEKFAAGQQDPHFFRLLDVARRIAGTGSLGVDRYVMLVEGKGSPDRNYLLDLKLSIPSVLRRHLRQPQPAWRTDAERVVATQRLVQAVSPALLNAVSYEGKSYVLKELQPTEDRINLRLWNGKLSRLKEVMQAMGQITAWSQLRGSARQGSAVADELMSLGAQTRWRKGLLALSTHAALQVEQDWGTFAAFMQRGAKR
jgi:uncharacterized protein (DUF2252 family)